MIKNNRHRKPTPKPTPKPLPIPTPIPTPIPPPPISSYNVKTYGAVGDNSHDDTNAIQAAINAVDTAVGGTVYVPNGVYLVRYNAQGGNSSLNLKSNMTFQMDAGAEIRLTSTNSERYQILNVGNVQGVTIIGGTIIGDRTSHVGTTGEYGFGISVWNGKNITIGGIKSCDCWGDGIMIDGANSITTQNVVVHNAICDNNRRQGISICNLSGGGIINSILTNNTGTSPESGLDLEPWADGQSVTNLIISGNTMSGNGTGFCTGASSTKIVNNITFTGNIIESNRGSGTWIQLANDWVIDHNSIFNNGRTTDDCGLGLYGCWNINVNNNTIRGSSGEGVRLQEVYGVGTDTHNCLVQYNTIDGNKGWDVTLLNGAYSNTVTHNIFAGSVYTGVAKWFAGEGNIISPNP